MKKEMLALLLLMVACIAVVSAFSSSRGWSQQTNKKAQPDANDQEPTADYQAPEPADPQQRAKRKARGKKYEKANVPIDPSGGGLVSTLSSHWDEKLPALPVDQSNAIVIGTVNEVGAFLSPNKASIYSEFVIDVGKIVKNDALKPLSSGEQITGERQGGRLRIPGGGFQRYVIAGQSFPRRGKRYIFFLTRNTQDEKYFYILTAYELRQDGVFPLDNVRRFKSHEGQNEQIFLNEIQNSVAASSSRPK